MGSGKLVALECFALFLSMSFFDSAAGRLVNITVDDTNPDPVSGATFLYAPAPGHWHDGNGCDGCSARPDPSLTYDATWHDATFDPHSTLTEEQEVETASLQFHGSAFYVYGILSQSTTGPRSTEDLSFFIDGQLSGSFSYAPPNPGQSTYTYNVLLYANDSIPTGQHTFMLQNGRAGGTVSLILLDYVIYTTELSDPNLSEATTLNPPSTTVSDPSSTTVSNLVSSAISKPATATSTRSTLLTSTEVPAGSAESTASKNSEPDASSPSSPSPSESLSSSSVPRSPASHTAAIISAAILVPVAAVSGVVVLLLYIRRCRSRRHAAETDDASPDEYSIEAAQSLAPYTERSDSGLRTVSQMKGQASSHMSLLSRLDTAHGDVGAAFSETQPEVSSAYPPSERWTSLREDAPPAYDSLSSAR